MGIVGSAELKLTWIEEVSVLEIYPFKFLYLYESIVSRPQLYDACLSADNASKVGISIIM